MRAAVPSSVDLYTAAINLLAHVTTRMTAAGITLPALQYVAPGSVITPDTEQVAVGIGRLFSGEPGSEHPVQSVRLGTVGADLNISVVRSTPTMQNSTGQPVLPSVSALQANAQLIATDGLELHRALIHARDTYAVVDRGIPVGVGPTTVGGPEGGVVWVSSIFSIQVL